MTQIIERRKVGVDLSDRHPILTTPGGHAPMACNYVIIKYDLADGRLTAVTVQGFLTEARDIARREATHTRPGGGNRVLVRRLSVDWPTGVLQHAPSWLLPLIEQYRPRVQPTDDAAERVIASYVDPEHVPGWQNMITDLFALRR